jgi:hypothetical protein
MILLNADGYALILPKIGWKMKVIGIGGASIMVWYP